ncbi:UPF0687 protein C20orf27 homolog isoform X2 [Cygnus atratus]|uniref:UPF0687 protein C20orf27 homolog isoform X2 n=1 Tax=Cygnus atratus TaxID=8868 RepID=UPI0021B74E78|nr:UPF0687 protein C20orf27 homolog isoform X2 [Cygnus atratus]
MAALGPAAGNGGLRALYRWVDAVPLSRPRRNIARDFSDGVLAAELVKFFFPAMVQLHSYVPASSTPQKLANWGHLNRKVLSKLNFSLPDEVIRQVVQCRPGTVEQVLLLLRQKIEEKQKQSKAVPGPEQELGVRTAQEEIGYLETGRAGPSDPTVPFCFVVSLSPRLTGYSGAKSTGQGCAQESPGAAGGNRSRLGYAQHPAGDTAAIHLQLAEKEQALLLAQETVQLRRRPSEHGLALPPLKLGARTTDGGGDTWLRPTRAARRRRAACASPPASPRRGPPATSTSRRSSATRR